MKNSNLENWLNELNEMAGINNQASQKSRHAFETLNAEIEKLISVSLKEKMMKWENERKDRKES
jgi:hypothetical protein